MRKRAFTLIELLVVIAIIAILAAILFPVFAKAREKARTSSCASNLKQQALAVMQYAQDFDETHPLGRNDVGDSWRELIQPYIKSIQVFKCPSNTATANANDDACAISYAVNGGYDTAAKHHDVANGYGSIAQTQGIGMAGIQSPASLILLCESKDGSWRVNISEDAGGAQRLFYGHNGMSNYAFCDGHVKLMKPVATATPGMLWGNGCEGHAMTTGLSFLQLLP